MGYKRIKKKKFFKKGLPKYQIKGQVEAASGNYDPTLEEYMMNPVPPLATEAIDAVKVIDEMDVVPTDVMLDQVDIYEPQEFSEAEETLPVPPSEREPVYETDVDAVTENDIIMAALMNDKKVKLRKDGTIKKIKKTGGIAKGKFLRRGGSTGRKFL